MRCFAMAHLASPVVPGAVPAVYAPAVAEGLAPANITAVVQRYLRR